jgi:hypothetical protein
MKSTFSSDPQRDAAMTSQIMPWTAIFRISSTHKSSHIQVTYTRARARTHARLCLSYEQMYFETFPPVKHATCFVIPRIV